MPNKKSKVWSALKFEGLEQEQTQEQISEAVGRHNDNLWKSISNGSVKLSNVNDICDYLKIEVVIRNPKTKKEYVLNDVD